MNSKSEKNSTSIVDDGVRVAVLHKQKMDAIELTESTNSQRLSAAIESSEKLLLSLGLDIPVQGQPSTNLKPQSILLANTWDDILAEAKESTPENIDFSTLLSQSEIDTVLKKHKAIGGELDWFTSLDRYDLALAVATGVIAGVIDVLLVGVPAHPGFMGAPKSEGGWLSNLMKEKTDNLFPPDKIKELERAYKVSYDASTSSTLNQAVEGLGPSSHRFQSLGHDPLLGFVFGVRDILTGEFSGISKNGHLIVQHVTDPFLEGENIFVRILEAMKVQLGHLASDVATSRGLPAPLMPLLQFLQFGKIGNHEYTIGEVARQMYRSGYDSRHFIAGSIPVMITEVIIRLGYFIRSIREGKTLAESIPTASSVKLRRQLLIAHSVATLINAGKVYVTQNPLAISWAQTLAFLRYVMPELAFMFYGKEAARLKMVEDEIVNDYHRINNQLKTYIQSQGEFVLII